MIELDAALDIALDGTPSEDPASRRPGEDFTLSGRSCEVVSEDFDEGLGTRRRE